MSSNKDRDGSRGSRDDGCAPDADDAPTDSKRFSEEKEALVDMAQRDKQTGGITEGDMQVYDIPIVPGN